MKRMKWEHRAQEIVDFYLLNKYKATIEHFGICKSSLASLLRRHKIWQPRDFVRKQLMVEMRSRGGTFQAIANEFGVSKNCAFAIIDGDGRNEFFTLRELCRFLGISRYSLQKAIDKAGIEAVRTGWLKIRTAIPASDVHKIRIALEERKQTKQEKKVLIICHTCGKERLRLRSDIDRNEHTFCSRHCLGTWLGKTFGWGRKTKLLQVES